MRGGLYRKIVIGILLLQTIAVAVIFAFLFNYIKDPSSEFNRNLAEIIKQQTQSFKPLQGEKGEKGDSIKGDDGRDGRDGNDGKDGKDGKDGTDGSNGSDGRDVTPEQIAAAVSRYLAENPPPKGDKGDQGEPGTNGAVAEFRCNPDTAMQEYKYPDDSDWSQTGGRCIPATGGNNGQ